MVLKKILLFLMLSSSLALSAVPSSVTLPGKVPGYDFGDIAQDFGLRMHRRSGEIEFRRKNTSLKFFLPKKEISFNGIKVIPGYAPVSCTSRPAKSQYSLVLGRWVKSSEAFPAVAVSRSDWKSTFRPLLDPHSVPGHKIARITLDAGHGGSDTGALGKRSKEKVLTLKITQRTAAILRSCGYKVYLTRSSDKEISLKKRSQLQRQHKSDLFVSIHINAAANRSVSGIETFALTSADAPSSMGKAEKISNPANVRDGNNVLLAYHLQKALIGRTKAVDRGVKRARFAVLKDISAPGALVEVGFISNAAEEAKLNQKDYVEKLARAIAEGIIAYHRSLKR